MKSFLKTQMQNLGNLQATILLSVVYLLFFWPYGLVLRLFRQGLLPMGEWHQVKERPADINRLRRTF